MNDIKRKLTSRKFWVAVVSFLTAVLTAFNADSLTVEQIALIVSGVGALICYIFAEAKVDAAHAQVGELLPEIVESTALIEREETILG